MQLDALFRPTSIAVIGASDKPTIGRRLPPRRICKCPLAPASRAEIAQQIDFITGDGNPLDAWGSGTFAANVPRALALFDASPEHDIIAFCRDGCDGQPFYTPELARTYLDLFAAAAARSAKPHYLLHTRPGVMDRTQIAHLRTQRIPVVSGLREGLTAIDRIARWAMPRDRIGARDGQPRRTPRRVARSEPALGEAAIADLA